MLTKCVFFSFVFADLQFPVDVAAVAKDHPFLEQDSLQSLFRRLHALNRSANMKVDNLQAQAQVGRDAVVLL